jgi:glutamine---fructose-6-phosphate transaminase (isomerizing)
VTTHMRQEIEEIPSIVADLVGRSRVETGPVGAAVRAARPRLAVIVARGTSDHAGTYARYLIETHLGMIVGLAAASVTTVYGRRLDWRDTLLIAFSQSGQGPDVVAVTEEARDGGAITVAVTNDLDSPLARSAEHVLGCHAGVERSVAATKTYVAELAAVALLVASVAPESEMAQALPRLPAILESTVVAASRWLDRERSLVASLAAADRALVVSRGYNYATALEVALKLKETSRIFAEGYSAADLAHGPITLARPGIPLLAFRPDGPMGAALDRDLERALAGGTRPWFVGGSELERGHGPGGAAGTDQDGTRLSLVLDAGPEALTPLSYVIPGQLLAEAVSRARGLDPDAPDGLTKVTRTT